MENLNFGEEEEGGGSCIEITFSENYSDSDETGQTDTHAHHQQILGAGGGKSSCTQRPPPP